MSSSHDTRLSVAEQVIAEQLAVETRIHRRTVLVELRGEMDLSTAPKVAETIDALKPRSDGVRHIVLDLRGLTFMDSTGLRELLRQNERAREHRRNLAVVRGNDAIQRLLKLTGVDELFVMVDEPEDLVPPSADQSRVEIRAATEVVALPVNGDGKP